MYFKLGSIEERSKKDLLNYDYFENQIGQVTGFQHPWSDDKKQKKKPQEAKSLIKNSHQNELFSQQQGNYMMDNTIQFLIVPNENIDQLDEKQFLFINSKAGQSFTIHDRFMDRQTINVQRRHHPHSLSRHDSINMENMSIILDQQELRAKRKNTPNFKSKMKKQSGNLAIKKFEPFVSLLPGGSPMQENIRRIFSSQPKINTPQPQHINKLLNKEEMLSARRTREFSQKRQQFDKLNRTEQLELCVRRFNNGPGNISASFIQNQLQKFRKNISVIRKKNVIENIKQGLNISFAPQTPAKFVNTSPNKSPTKGLPQLKKTPFFGVMYKNEKSEVVEDLSRILWKTKTLKQKYMSNLSSIQNLEDSDS